MRWNYRVVKETKYMNNKYDFDHYQVLEVYYDDDGNIQGWSENAYGILSWDNYDDLKGTAEQVLEAFKKPVLVVTGDTLIEESTD